MCIFIGTPWSRKETACFGYLWEYGWALFWEFLYASWIYLVRGFQVIQACNPPDNIFLVALPFKALGVKFIFDFHDANPELYLAKYEKKGRLYDALGLVRKDDFQIQRYRYRYKPKLQKYRNNTRRARSGKRFHRSQWARSHDVQTSSRQSGA